MDKEVRECEFITYTVEKERVCDLLEDWCKCILCEKCDTRKLHYQEVANGILESELNTKEKQLHQSQQDLKVAVEALNNTNNIIRQKIHHQKCKIENEVFEEHYRRESIIVNLEQVSKPIKQALAKLRKE